MTVLVDLDCDVCATVGTRCLRWRKGVTKPCNGVER